MDCGVDLEEKESEEKKSFRNEQVDKLPNWNGMHPIMCLGILKDSEKKKS